MEDIEAELIQTTVASIFMLLFVSRGNNTVFLEVQDKITKGRNLLEVKAMNFYIDALRHSNQSSIEFIGDVLLTVYGDSIGKLVGNPE